MTMMGEYIDYENDLIIDSGFSNHIIDDQSGAMEAGWPLEKKVLPGLDNIEEILLQKMGEQTIHICLSAGMLENPSDINVDEQEVTQLSELGEKEMTTQ